MTTDLFIHRTGLVARAWSSLAAASVALRVARGLRHAPAEVVLIDRVNHHLFQPLLYQVAAVLLPPGDIAPSLRQVLADQPNTRVVLGEVRP
jgi:NADH dehydrogenase FAD-containing subunit